MGSKRQSGRSNKKLIITMKRYKNDIAVRRESPSGGWNRVLPWGKEKIDYRCEAKKNWLLPWGEEKIDYRREAWIAIRRNEIDSCREAKKNRLSPGGMNPRQAEWNRFLSWGKEKIDYRREGWIAIRRNETDSCREAKKKLIIAVRRELP